jgi:hypothetical protein
MRFGGTGTDGPGSDGFILIEGKKKRVKTDRKEQKSECVREKTHRKVAWADVDRNVARTRGQETTNRNKIVSGSLSRNNPVSNDEV